MVFFIRQRSQAFQTRLCLPSIPAACEKWSWWCAVVLLLDEVLARLVMRLAGFEDLLLEDVFFRDKADLGSSAGGEGKV